MLEQEIQTLKYEGRNLKEENKYQLKFIKLLSAGQDSETSLRNYVNYNPV